MTALLCGLDSLISFHLRDRASLALELITLRHQIGVLRRHRPGRMTLVRADALL